ncbi:BRO-N domain-containing protein [Phascolarctobacterium faecium]|jgi:toxin-antitoxin system, toxin component, bro family|uniref:BRO-N domain-containing protein n=1 Tax=Phascolarctobacterium faecium TaxID=33025 RepID=UPI00242D2B13|nr:BRO family protein [Phascolarctobacterium faecium]
MNLQVFENKTFGKVRVIERNNEPWFVGKDVAEVLGYSNPSKAVIAHVKDCHKKQEMIAHSQNGNVVTKTTLIDEAGLYSLVLRSKLPAAEDFQEWVVAEVIPSIRKTGKYIAPKQQTAIQQQRVEAMLLNAKSRQSKLWLTIAEKTDIPEYKHICQQKAAEALSGVPLLPMEEAKEITYSATDIGKMLGISANKIGKIANQYNLKTPQYGKLFYSKSEYSCKEVETFRYYECAIPKFREILKGGAVA